MEREPLVNSRQARRSALAFLAMAAHNAEEGLFARKWTLENAELLTQYAGRGPVELWAGPGFKLSLLMLTLILLALAILAARAAPRGAVVYLFLAVIAIFACNAVFPHIVGAIALGAYVPGVVTAVALVLPVGVWVYVTTLRDSYATRRGVFLGAMVGVVFYVTVAALVVAHE
jgi:hypothetical protein